MILYGKLLLKLNSANCQQYSVEQRINRMNGNGSGDLFDFIFSFKKGEFVIHNLVVTS
jgi:hypothetical protein